MNITVDKAKQKDVLVFELFNFMHVITYEINSKIYTTCINIESTILYKSFLQGVKFLFSFLISIIFSLTCFIISLILIIPIIPVTPSTTAIESTF